jgi:UDP-N-acetylglucosamine acyltransferase
MAVNIHPTAIVEPGAELDENVIIGAYAYVGAHVRISSGTTVMHHATVDGATVLGTDNEVHPYAYVGGKTHDLKYHGGIQRLQIGDRNVFREFTTIHCATADDQITLIGNDNVILSYSHVAHECVIGNHLIMSSHAAFGGHVIVGNHVNIGWGVGVHQFCRLGDYSMAGAASKVVQDVPPYMISDGNPAISRMVNKVGLERAGFSNDEIQLIRRVFKAFYKEGLNRSQALQKLQTTEDMGNAIVKKFTDFILASERGLS